MLKIKSTKVIIIVALTGLMLSCKKTSVKTTNYSKLFLISNEVASNRVLVYNRTDSGYLQYDTSYATGGTGTGAVIGCQGAVTLSKDGNSLLVVNPGSNELSSFRIYSDKMELISKKSSNGERPVSVAVSTENKVYALNNGGMGSVAGYTLNSFGELLPLESSLRSLIGTATSFPVQIQFTPDGKTMIVALRDAGRLIRFAVNNTGLLGDTMTLASVSPAPFGFDISNQNRIYITEAQTSAVGVYQITSTGLTNFQEPVLNSQKAACWLSITPNQLYCYTSNAQTNNLSAYKIDPSTGKASLIGANPIVTGTNPIEIRTSPDSKFVYALCRTSHEIWAYAVQSDGSLNYLSKVGGLPSASIGMAVR